MIFRHHLWRYTVKHNRSSLASQARYALTHPHRILPRLRRLARRTWLRPEVVKSTAGGPEGAPGSPSHRRWLALGRMQFDYLTKHGLKPEFTMLEIGCGNLRAGRLLIDYLDTGNYYGVDISPDVLFAAQETLVANGLRDKLPHLAPVRDLRFAFLPNGHFDVVHAHSVFSRSPLHVIEECFAHVSRVMKPDGWFDFTFYRAGGGEQDVPREDFSYRTETLVALADRYSLNAAFMDDWEQLPHKQSKIRITKRT
ncbi:MAG TPA: class I SAM-dependent methyltransferase [Nonomuraea sp.]|nr:class I SAM-dependent methyltransferase [Nonomuraea sp.]